MKPNVFSNKLLHIPRSQQWRNELQVKPSQDWWWARPGLAQCVAFHGEVVPPPQDPFTFSKAQRQNEEPAPEASQTGSVLPTGWSISHNAALVSADHSWFVFWAVGGHSPLGCCYWSCCPESWCWRGRYQWALIPLTFQPLCRFALLNNLLQSELKQHRVTK